jgi:hypothetical protein
MEKNKKLENSRMSVVRDKEKLLQALIKGEDMDQKSMNSSLRRDIYKIFVNKK